MTRGTLCSAVVAVLAILGPAILSAQEPVGYRALAGHYEAIRQALLHDSTDGIAAHAEGIRRDAEKLRQNFSARDAAIKPGRSPECLELLPEIENSATSLASSGTLDQARETFAKLSQAMVRYRQMLAAPDSVVVYCSMAEKVWIQPKGEIGNPYYGQSMARCGEIISE